MLGALFALLLLGWQCAGDGVRVRYQTDTSGKGAPCTAWSGRNLCVPDQSLDRRALDRWVESDLRLPPISHGSLPDRKAPGAVALVRYCTACHNLALPAMHAADDWGPILDRMHARIKEAVKRGRLSPQQLPSGPAVAQISDYLKKNALKAVGVADLPNGNSAGARALRARCVGCHALPDPAALTAERWSAVVQRMVGYSRHQKQPIAAEEAAAIQDYLRSQARK